MRTRFCALMTLAVLVTFAPAGARAQATDDQELYHVSWRKAPAGGLMAMAEALPREPAHMGAQARVIFAHVQGADWQFMVLTPLGRRATIDLDTRRAPSAAVQGPHSDDFVIGPSWTEVRKALGGDETNPVFIVTTVRARAGRGADLLKALEERRGDVVFRHAEGAASVITISRIASWNAFAQAMEKASTAGMKDSPLSEASASHEDTVAVHVSGLK